MGDIPEARLRQILALRGVAQTDPLLEIVDKDVLKEALGKDEEQDLKDSGMGILREGFGAKCECIAHVLFLTVTHA